MGELIDKAKGKAKEVTGVVTGDRALEAEGKADRAKGEVKGSFEELKQRAKDELNRPKHP
jgi:uncharacterized protein YjbJ (UPF0337 family)